MKRKRTRNQARGDSAVGTPAGAQELVQPHSNVLASRPDFLNDKKVVGTEGMQKYVTLPYLKIVQPQSAGDLKKDHSEGSVLFMPTADVVAPAIVNSKGSFEEGTPFHFVPVLFYPEWITWNDIKTKGKMNSIRERTLDKDSVIAKKAQDEDTREEQMPENPKMKIMHQEHLVFVVQIVTPGHPLYGQLVIMSFARALHRDGRQLAKLIKMRDASPFACVFEARAEPRSKEDFAWYGYKITNPSANSGVDGWVRDPQQFEALEKQYENLNKLLLSGRFQATVDDEEPTTARRGAEADGDLD